MEFILEGWEVIAILTMYVFHAAFKRAGYTSYILKEMFCFPRELLWYNPLLPGQLHLYV